MKNSWVIILLGLFSLLAVGFLYKAGFIKNLPTIKTPYTSDIELGDNCIRKTVDDSLSLSIFFESSDYKPYEKQKTEIYYKIKIKNTKCSISGEGYKFGDQIIDTLTLKKISKKYAIDKYPVVINGHINKDSLFLELSKKTDSTVDHKINLKFLFIDNQINTLRGNFDEELSNGHGKVKLTRISH